MLGASERAATGWPCSCTIVRLDERPEEGPASRVLVLELHAVDELRVVRMAGWKSALTVSSRVRCKLSIASMRSRTLSSRSSNPSSSTTSRAARRINIESGRTL